MKVTSKATVKKEDFEADDVKHSSSFESGVDGEISALQSEVGVFSESWLKMDITRADERHQECEELMIQRVQKNLFRFHRCTPSRDSDGTCCFRGCDCGSGRRC